jgi:hypothetical protein
VGTGTVAVTVMLLGPTAFIGVILSLASPRTLVATAAVMGAGPVLYAALHLARKHQVRRSPLNSHEPSSLTQPAYRRSARSNGPA